MRGAIKGSAKESKTKLEERSEYKLQREKRGEKEREKAASEKPKGRPFAFADPDRVQYGLFKVEKSSPTQWVRVTEA